MIWRLTSASFLCLMLGAAEMAAQTARPIAAVPRPPAQAPGPPKPEDGSAAPDGYAPIPEWLGQTRAPRPQISAAYDVETVVEGGDRRAERKNREARTEEVRSKKLEV